MKLKKLSFALVFVVLCAALVGTLAFQPTEATGRDPFVQEPPDLTGGGAAVCTYCSTPLCGCQSIDGMSLYASCMCSGSLSARLPLRSCRILMQPSWKN